MKRRRIEVQLHNHLRPANEQREPQTSWERSTAAWTHEHFWIEPLTAREQEVLAVLAHGASNQEIAEALIIAPNTVKRHVHTILAKLSARNRTQAVARARQLDLLASTRSAITSD